MELNLTGHQVSGAVTVGTLQCFVNGSSKDELLQHLVLYMSGAQHMRYASVLQVSGSQNIKINKYWL